LKQRFSIAIWLQLKLTPDSKKLYNLHEHCHCELQTDCWRQSLLMQSLCFSHSHVFSHLRRVSARVALKCHLPTAPPKKEKNASLNQILIDTLSRLPATYNAPLNCTIDIIFGKRALMNNSGGAQRPHERARKFFPKHARYSLVRLFVCGRRWVCVKKYPLARTRTLWFINKTPREKSKNSQRRRIIFLLLGAHA
jgi:hypothetical protein